VTLAVDPETAVSPCASVVITTNEYVEFLVTLVLNMAL